MQVSIEQERNLAILVKGSDVFLTKLADKLEHAVIMRATPIDFSAILALPEFPESLENVGVNLPFDDNLVYRVNPAVAIHATCKGLQLTKQVKCEQDFLQLLPGLTMPQPVPVRYTALLKYPQASSEDNSLMPQG